MRPVWVGLSLVGERDGIGMGMGMVGLTWTSRPAVKARSPAPVSTTARTSASCESFLKMEERLSHILGGRLAELGCVVSPREMGGESKERADMFLW